MHIINLLATIIYLVFTSPFLNKLLTLVILALSYTHNSKKLTQWKRSTQCVSTLAAIVLPQNSQAIISILLVSCPSFQQNGGGLEVIINYLLCK